MRAFSRICLIIGLLLSSQTGFAQVSETFADSNFTMNPVWQGDVNDFKIDTPGLRLAALHQVNKTTYLSTSIGNVNFAERVQWEFQFEMNFNLSSARYLRYYLLSDSADLTGSLNGYYLQIGLPGSRDTIQMFQQNGISTSLVFTGSLANFNNSPNGRIRVTRFPNGRWFFETDDTGGTNFQLEGDTLYPALPNNAAFTGGAFTYSSASSTLFWLDDIYIRGKDTIPPVLLGATALSADSVVVSFDEVVGLTSANNPMNYTLLNSGLNPTSASRMSPDSSQVLLLFSPGLHNDSTYQLEVCNIADTAGFIMSACDTASFYYFEPDIPVFGDVIINEVQASSLAPFNSDYVEFFNRSAKTFDLKDWLLFDNSGQDVVSPSSYVLKPGEYVAITDGDLADFSPHTNIARIIKINGTLILSAPGELLVLTAPDSTVLDSVHYGIAVPSDSGKKESRELTNPYGGCYSGGEWKWCTDSLGGTPGMENSVFDTTGPTTPPMIISVSIGSQIEICFDQPLDTSVMLNSSIYGSNLPGFTVLGVIGVAPDYTCIEITYAGTPPSPGQIYQLTIDSVVSCYGTTANNLTYSFGEGAIPSAGDLVFNEIYAQAQYANGLPPDVEWVEIHNTTNLLLALDSLLFIDDDVSADTSYIPPGTTLQPYGYLVLVDQADVADFPGISVGLDGGLPDLLGGGECLEIWQNGGSQIDRVCYNDDLYDNDNSKKYRTIERKNPNFPCFTYDNWALSTATLGGTPGDTNSVLDPNFGDTIRPRLLKAEVLDSISIRLHFSEAMSLSSLTDPGSFALNPSLPIASLIPEQPSLEFVEVRFTSPMMPEILYQIKLTGAAMDCIGNMHLSDSAYFGIPGIPVAGELIINEILFDQPTGRKDYIEFYNNSDRFFDLSQIDLTYLGNTDTISLSNEFSVMLPRTYLCLTEDRDTTISYYFPPDTAIIVENSDLHTFKSDTGTVSILNSLGETLDRFSYDKDQHFEQLKITKGVSLERITFEDSIQGFHNWHSAAATANYGTPGYKNSTWVDPTNSQPGTVQLEEKIFTPGSGTPLIINYQFPIPPTDVRVTVFDSCGRLVKIVTQNTSVGTKKGFFHWSGTDRFENIVDMGMYVILFEGVIGDQKVNFKESAVVTLR